MSSLARAFRQVDGKLGIEFWNLPDDQLHTVTINGEDRHIVARHGAFALDDEATTVTVSVNGGPALDLKVLTAQPPMNRVNRNEEPGWSEIEVPPGPSAIEVAAFRDADRAERRASTSSRQPWAETYEGEDD